MYGYCQIEAIAMKRHFREIANTSNIVQNALKTRINIKKPHILIKKQSFYHFLQYLKKRKSNNIIYLYGI
jgi:hypothetical protein